MKKISKITCILLLIIITLSTIIFISKKDKKILENKEKEKNNYLTYMLETVAGSNKYEAKTDIKFPLDGYHINIEESKCENGGELIWNDEKGKVETTLSSSDRCYLYFDNTQVKSEFTYTGNYETYTAPTTGTFKIELWGSSGNDDTYGGKGAYVVGNIELKRGEKLFIYIGEKGKYVQTTNTEPEYTFNGGGSGSLTCLEYYQTFGKSTFGGGATDIRLKSGNWDDFDSLKSRIMVAAGGGGGYNSGTHWLEGGAGGALEGFDGQKDTSEWVKENYAGKGATQTSGGNANGSFGKGGNALLNTYCNINDGMGGGSGYYGGGGAHGYKEAQGAGGAGGSSFISGYKGCVAIKEDSTEKNVIPKDNCTNGTTNIECSYHYSGKVFTETNMIAGNEEMPKPDGGTEVGHTGNGYAKITFIK